MESWRLVCREHFLPHVSDAGLAALRNAVLNDDQALMQGATTLPAPLQCTMDWPVESACLIGYAGWKGDGLNTVAEVEEFFARFCYDIDQSLGEPAGCRHLLTWFDETDRATVLRELLPEIELEIARRKSCSAQERTTRPAT